MRIAFAMINCNRRDGSARAVNEVAERLARRGHDVHLFARRAEDLDLSLVRWHRVPGLARPEVADFWTYFHAANRAIRPAEFDIVHSVGCNTRHANIVTIQNIQPAKRLVLDRFAAQERVSLPRRFTRWLYLRVTSTAERQCYLKSPAPTFLPVSRGVETQLRRFYPIGDAPVRIIPNAADPAVFHPIESAARAAWRSAAGFAPADRIAIFSGGEWARKGLDLAIQAILRIDDPAVKLFIAGDDPDRARFRALAASSPRIVFGGFRRDIATALAACDLFLFPSHYEAFSLATIEAAACGLPVLATRINGAEDFVQPGRTGDFIDHEPPAIAATVSRWLHDDSARLAAGAAARRLVERHYTWDRIADATEDAYRARLTHESSRRQP